jgi:hypothetical protein
VAKRLRRGSAKPLSGGSNPPVASMLPSELPPMKSIGQRIGASQEVLCPMLSFCRRWGLPGEGLAAEVRGHDGMAYMEVLKTSGASHEGSNPSAPTR